jgi:hypothetical protein
LKSMFSKNMEEPFLSAAVETTDSFPEPDATPLPTLDQAVAIAHANRPEVPIAEGNIKEPGRRPAVFEERAAAIRERLFAGK